MKVLLPKLFLGGLIFMTGQGVIACNGEEQIHKRAPVANGVRTVSEAEVLARVDGAPITLSDVRDFLEEVDNAVGPEEAFARLLERELLVREARRRGYAGHADVLDEQSKELARVILKRNIEEATTGDSLDQKKLRAYYEFRKSLYVHGVKRKVSHLLVPTGKKNGAGEEDARAAVLEIARTARAVADLDAFEALGDQYSKSLGLKVKYESLPAFAADSVQFAREFVDAAFAVPRVPMASEAFKTSHGWHVLYVVTEIPSQNRSFEEVRDELISEVLFTEKKMRYKALVKSLESKSRVLVVEDHISGE